MVRFSKIPDQMPVQTDAEAEGIAEIDPYTDGKWVWKDAVTLEFRPSEALTSNQRYEVSLNLDKLFKNVPEKEAKPTLAIATFQQQLNIS